MTLTAHRAPEHEAPTEGPDTADLVITHTAEPRRRRRRHRTVDRVRIGLAVVAALVGGTMFSALPIADDITGGTLDFFSIGPTRPDIELQEPDSASNGAPDTVDRPQPASIDGSVWVDPTLVGVAPPGPVEGVLTFRGSPTRSWYGAGPVPDQPEIRWRYPRTGGLCRSSTVGADTSVWCGTGWTGQPTLFRRDGRLWTVFGALDGNIHFLDAATGDPLLPSFPTGDIVKGSVTIDPDGYPLVYAGSRDNRFRVIAFDGDTPREVWSLDADSFADTRWNNDWDGAAVVIDDHLFVGGENSRIHVVRLHRGYDDAGLAVVDPAVVFSAPGWDAQLLADVGDDNVSIENSVAISGDTLWFANSAGLVQGWDLDPLRRGEEPIRSFRFWVGDDVDASIVTDADGMLYVAAEYERGTDRSRELGQLVKLDPRREGDDAVVWAVTENQGLGTGIWGTPALHRGTVIFASEGGNLRSVDQATGESLWTIRLGRHLWQSPVVVDDVLLMGDCTGTLRAYDVADPRQEPSLLWDLRLDTGCIESTPAVFGGTIVLGTRSGGVYGIGEG